MDQREEGEVQRDVQAGISAVLAADAAPTDIDDAVLDLAAVLDGLVNENFEIIIVPIGSANSLTGSLAELHVRHPDLALHVLDGGHVSQAAALAAGFEAA